MVLVGTGAPQVRPVVADLRLAAEENPAIAEIPAAIRAGTARIEDLIRRGPAAPIRHPLGDGGQRQCGWTELKRQRRMGGPTWARPRRRDGLPGWAADAPAGFTDPRSEESRSAVDGYCSDSTRFLNCSKPPRTVFSIRWTWAMPRGPPKVSWMASGSYSR